MGRMATLVPVMGTALVGTAVGAVLSLAWGRPLVLGAAWGTLGGALFGLAAFALLALSPG